MLSMNKKFILSAAIILATSGYGCTYHSSLDGVNHDHRYTQANNPNLGWQAAENSYRPMYTSKLLSDYTEQLTMKLIENMRYVTDRAPIAVTSFVNLDNNLQTTSIFGNQLAESFISELQEFGLSVVDYKHTGAIRVTDKGDFSFSRDRSELSNYPAIEYVLSGTLTYNNRGVIINARLVGNESKVVVATAKGFIPHFVVNSLYSSKRRDGVMLNAVD